MKVLMPPETRHELASGLTNERERILASLRSLAEARRGLAASQAEEGAALGPPADVASDLAEVELDLGLEEAAQHRLQEVEAALKRVADGRYGTCEHCDGIIEAARLEALPWARFCLACAGHPMTAPTVTPF